MRDRYFDVKFLNLLLIVLLLAGYQTVIHAREQEEKIAELEYQLEIAERAGAQGSADAGVSGEDAAKNAEGAGYQDGVYTGGGEGFGGTIEAEVKVENGRVASVEVTKAEGEDSAYLETAMSITDQIIEEQGADVDTVSGATFSSGGIRDAVKAALEQAVAQ